MSRMPPTDAELSPRRQQLVDAATLVVARSGLRGLTHRAVDAEAGLPEGTASAYLRTRLALLTALVEHVSRTLMTDVARTTEGLADDAEPADVTKCVIDLLVRWADHPELMVVSSELMLEAMRQPELMAAYRPWRDGLIALVAASIRAHGRDEPEARARAIFAALQGVITSSLLQPEDERAEYLRRTGTMVLASLAAYETSA
jgi:DNA-binding transcriptional regulator YbjK